MATFVPPRTIIISVPGFLPRNPGTDDFFDIQLDHTKKSSAVLGPVNSSDYLFGCNAQREKLFDDISKSREAKP